MRTEINLLDRVPEDIGLRLHDLARELYPITRSITGQGVRDTLAIVDGVVTIDVAAVPSGTEVFDWVVPDEWTFRAAYIEDIQGRRVVDAADSNLHVVSYSTPVHERIPLEKLSKRLHSLPNHPDWIPYRTAYYKPNWGFCVTDRQLRSMTDPEYDVVIDTVLEPGVLNYGEVVIPGESSDEFLITAHVCHPSLANDNLSGIGIAAWLGRLLKSGNRPRYTYRIVFAPGTIGAIAWLALNGDAVGRVRHGLVAALLGRPGPLTYKRTWAGNAEIDRAVAQVFRERETDSRLIDFSPWGYDERQFNAPGIRLPVGRLTRAAEEGYPEYHTSADNLELVTPEALADAFRAVCGIVETIEANACYRNLKPYGEPRLGKYGLADDFGGASSVEAGRLALLWVLNMSDGENDLLAIAERSGLWFRDVLFAARRLASAGLLENLAGDNEGTPR